MRPRPLLIAGAAVAVVAGLAALAVALLRAGADAGLCTTTKSVVADAATALAPRFAVAELGYECRGPIGSIELDGAGLALTSSGDFRSRAALVAAVRARLVAAGWRAEPGRQRLTRRAGATTYTATLRASSRAPALALVRLRSTRPSQDAGSAPAGALAERRLAPADRLRFVTVSAFVPEHVPAGHERWTAPRVVDFDDVEVTLTGGAGAVRPQLRTQRVPDGWSRRECDVFVARSAGDRCQRWGTTRGGLDVDIARDEITADGLAGNPTAIVDGTLVTLLHGHNHRSVDPPLTRGDVLRIFDTLRAANTPARR